jgi:hypothetical protein
MRSTMADCWLRRGTNGRAWSWTQTPIHRSHLPGCGSSASSMRDAFRNPRRKLIGFASYIRIYWASAGPTETGRFTRLAWTISSWSAPTICRSIFSGRACLNMLGSAQSINSRVRKRPVIVASPRLLETARSTIEQLRLVNALCWAKNFADGYA